MAKFLKDIGRRFSSSQNVLPPEEATAAFEEFLKMQGLEEHTPEFRKEGFSTLEELDLLDANLLQSKFGMQLAKALKFKPQLKKFKAIKLKELKTKRKKGASTSSLASASDSPTKDVEFRELMGKLDESTDVNEVYEAEGDDEAYNDVEAGSASDSDLEGYEEMDMAPPHVLAQHGAAASAGLDDAMDALGSLGTSLNLNGATTDTTADDDDGRLAALQRRPLPKPRPLDDDDDDDDDYEKPVEQQDLPLSVTAADAGPVYEDGDDDMYEAPPDTPSRRQARGDSSSSLPAVPPRSPDIDIEDQEEYEVPDVIAGQQRRERSSFVKTVPATPDLAENPATWNTAEVLRWLKMKGLDDFKDAFYANGFDGSKLLALSASSFKRGGFPEDRCDVLGNAILELREQKRRAVAGGGGGGSGGGAAKRPAPVPAQRPKKAPAPPPPAVSDDGPAPEMCRAIFEYKADKPGKLSMFAGEEFIILDQTSSWWRVRNSSGQEGKIPTNYVEVIGGAAPAVPRRAAPVPDDYKTAEWFFGAFDRTEAKGILLQQPTGTFLVRNKATNELDFTLDIRGEDDGSVVHLKIAKNASGRWTLGKSSTTEYHSIPALVEQHRTTPIKVAGKSTLTLQSACPKP